MQHPLQQHQSPFLALYDHSPPRGPPSAAAANANAKGNPILIPIPTAPFPLSARNTDPNAPFPASTRTDPNANAPFPPSIRNTDPTAPFPATTRTADAANTLTAPNAHSSANANANATTSIWAPQPQAWPCAFPLARAAQEDDVFGAFGVGGVVGTGGNWNGSASPDSSMNMRADTHVEQLLRTLDLNSPEPELDAETELVSTTRSSPGSTSVASGHSSGAGSVLSVRSAGSGGSIGSGRNRPARLVLDIGYVSHAHSTVGSPSATAAANVSANNSASANTSGSSASANTSAFTTANTTASSDLSLHLSSDDSIPSIPSLTHSNANSHNSAHSNSNSSPYPQSPDFSPLSLGSALLTPLDSPGHLPLHSPTQSLHSPLHGHGLHSPLHGSLHSPLHGHGHGGLHSPLGHGSYSPGGAGGLHSPGWGGFYKERAAAGGAGAGVGGGVYGAYDPPSPFHDRHGHGMLGSPGAYHYSNSTQTQNPHAHAHAHSRFVPLPATPPSLNLNLHAYGQADGAAGYYEHTRAGSGASLGAGLGLGSIGALGGGGTHGDGYRGRADWMRADDGLGLGLGQGFSPTAAGLGGSALFGGSVGVGLGGLGDAEARAGALRASFVYQQQQQVQQQVQQVQQAQQAQAQAQAQQQQQVQEQQQQAQQAQAQVQAQQHQQQQAQQQQRQQQQEAQQAQQAQDALGLGLAAFSKGWELGGAREGGASAAAAAVGAGRGAGSPGGGGAVGAGASGGGVHGHGHGHGQAHGHGGGHAHGAREGRAASGGGNEPINFLSLLHPASSPPYATFVARIIKNADQQASIFLQQKLKVAGSEERGRIVDAICARGGEMMMHRFGNWAVQRCLEAASSPDERRKIVACMRGRVVDLATNCYGCHVLQKALDCEEEEVRLLIVSELLTGDPAQTLVNKHASHVWSKIMELSWTPPAPPIFAYVNRSLKGKWAALACHETGSLVVQHAFENLEETAKDGIVDELLGQGAAVFGEVAKSQWGSYCIQHILEHGSEKHRQMALEHLLAGLLEFATNEQGSKSVVKMLKEGGKETLDRVVQRMCEPAKGARRAMIVDLALSLTGSQLIASVLPTADKDQRAQLYDCIRGHIVTLRGCKTGSKVIWLFDRMRAYYGY